jgi:serine acetyltransferase
VVGDDVLIGSSATILQGRFIASKNVIGAGTLCLNEISGSNGIWVGIPATRQSIKI